MDPINKIYSPHTDPLHEPPIANESAQINEICTLINKVQAHNFALHRHAFRGTHVKTQAIAKGSLHVHADLPPHLAQGLFARGAVQYDVAVRFANEPSFLRDDRAPGPRGCGMKVFGVSARKSEGESAGAGEGGAGWLSPKGEESATQDFTFNNAPVLELRDLATCREIFTLRERYFHEPDRLKEALAQRQDKELQFAPEGLPNRHFLSYTMYSQSAYRYGELVAKFALRPKLPAQKEMQSQSSAQVDQHSDREQHSRWLGDWFATDAAEFEFCVQLCRDPQKQSVEDCSVEWDEREAPFEVVATLTLHAGQDVLDPQRWAFWDDRMVLNPWAGLAEHRPMGSANRLRREVYGASRGFREKRNARELTVVKSVDEIP